jgi:sortase A
MGPWLLRAERTAWVVGLVLAGIWGGARGLAFLSSERSLHAFEVAQGTADRGGLGQEVLGAAMGAAPAKVDQSLWDRGRIRAYAAAITRPGPPPLAVLRVPRLRLEVPVLDGTDEWTLDRGAGHIAGTARPGEMGNVGIAGHRDGFFRVLKDIATGDVMELALPGEVRRYRVEKIWIVRPEDVSVLDPAPRSVLTLVTCYPFYFVGSAPERFIVRAEQVP